MTLQNIWSSIISLSDSKKNSIFGAPNIFVFASRSTFIYLLILICLNKADRTCLRNNKSFVVLFSDLLQKISLFFCFVCLMFQLAQSKTCSSSLGARTTANKSLSNLTCTLTSDSRDFSQRIMLEISGVVALPHRWGSSRFIYKVQSQMLQTLWLPTGVLWKYIKSSFVSAVGSWSNRSVDEPRLRENLC